MKRINLQEVKMAMKDAKFRESLPESFKSDITKYLQNPECGCNHPIYVKILKEAREQLKKYFPNQEIEEYTTKAFVNNWSVVNCHINELESKLKELSNGRKQLAVARYEDQVTLIINDLDVI